MFASMSHYPSQGKENHIMILYLTIKERIKNTGSDETSVDSNVPCIFECYGMIESNGTIDHLPSYITNTWHIVQIAAIYDILHNLTLFIVLYSEWTKIRYTNFLDISCRTDVCFAVRIVVQSLHNEHRSKHFRQILCIVAQLFFASIMYFNLFEGNFSIYWKYTLQPQLGDPF